MFLNINDDIWIKFFWRGSILFFKLTWGGGSNNERAVSNNDSAGNKSHLFWLLNVFGPQ